MRGISILVDVSKCLYSFFLCQLWSSSESPLFDSFRLLSLKKKQSSENKSIISRPTFYHNRLTDIESFASNNHHLSCVTGFIFSTTKVAAAVFACISRAGISSGKRIIQIQFSYFQHSHVPKLSLTFSCCPINYKIDSLTNFFFGGGAKLPLLTTLSVRL